MTARVRLLVALGAATAAWAGVQQDRAATVTASSADDVHAAIAQAQDAGSVHIYLEEGSRLQLDYGPIAVAGICVRIFSSGAGATIDAMQHSRAFTVSHGGGLILEKVHVTGGMVRWTDELHGGGCIFVHPGCNLTLFDAQLSHCVADGRGTTSQTRLAVPSANGGGISAQGGAI
jgi:hypothetical protein